MTFGHQHEQCELCSVGTRGAGRLCASCSEMIVRLKRISQEVKVQVAPQTQAAGKRAHAARLYERAPNINIFTFQQNKHLQ